MSRCLRGLILFILIVYSTLLHTMVKVYKTMVASILGPSWPSPIGTTAYAPG